MSWTWGAPNPDQRLAPPDLRSHPIPITDLLAQIHNGSTRDPQTEQPTDTEKP